MPIESSQSSSSPQPTKRIVSRRLSLTKKEKEEEKEKAKVTIAKSKALPDLSHLWNNEHFINGLDTVKQATPGLIAGFFAGGAAAIASNPMDVVKTRLQTQHIKPGPLAFVTDMKQLFVEEGVRKAFLRGIVPKLVTTAPLGMLSSVMYEGILYFSRKSPLVEQEVAGNKKEK